MEWNFDLSSEADLKDLGHSPEQTNCEEKFRSSECGWLQADSQLASLCPEGPVGKDRIFHFPASWLEDE